MGSGDAGELIESGKQTPITRIFISLPIHERSHPRYSYFTCFSLEENIEGFCKVQSKKVSSSYNKKIKMKNLEWRFKKRKINDEKGETNFVEDGYSTKGEYVLELGSSVG